ncbi:MAG: hypothetical protein ACRENE_22585 [Polyangiaceae bacterium]
MSHPSLAGSSVSSHVTTTQVAPTILRSLGIPTFTLLGVVRERTKVLPGLPM